MNDKQVKLEVTLKLRFTESKEDELKLIEIMKESISNIAHFTTRGTAEVEKVVIKKK
ncbi:unnamed protein product [marine sediment metagenome]|uniref:Uncharacterized protein n=1 Tax=marine sediment metagenome TaxID=412755 RepID=X1TWG6_9ZZZZ